MLEQGDSVRDERGAASHTAGLLFPLISGYFRWRALDFFFGCNVINSKEREQSILRAHHFKVSSTQMQATEYDLPSYDLFNRESSAFAGSVTASDRGPTVLCINDVDIPCRSELYTTDRVTASLFIVGLVDPGWSKVRKKQPTSIDSL